LGLGLGLGLELGSGPGSGLGFEVLYPYPNRNFRKLLSARMGIVVAHEDERTRDGSPAA
jgi:hypothetical protein